MFLRNFLVLIFILFNCFGYFAQEVSTDSLKIEGWQNSGKTTFLINQTAFSNWTSGGESSIAATLSVDYNLNYYKNG